MSSGAKIKLTALVVTYNHVRYVEEAVKSVIMQETDFATEVIISEDCSTDGTREIVRSIAEAYPGRVKLLLSERNRNDNSVLRRGLETASGTYVALLDGDDVWTSKDKLQKQVDLLDARPDVAISFHNVEVLYEDGLTSSHPFYVDGPSGRIRAPVPEPVLQLVDLVAANRIQTCAAVFRREYVVPLPSWYDTAPFGDWPLHLLSAQHGSIDYMDEVMATYRVHPGSYWTSNVSLYQNLGDVELMADMYRLIERELGSAYVGRARVALTDLYTRRAAEFYVRGDYAAAAICGWRGLKAMPRRELLKRWKVPAVTVLASVRHIARALPARRQFARE